MTDLKKIDFNSVIICPSEQKEEILPLLFDCPEYKIKFLNKKELLNGTFFTYDDRAVAFLMKKGYSYDLAEELLKNMTFLAHGTEKLDMVVDLKDELYKAGLLHFNTYFRYLFRNKSVYVYGYSEKDEELKRCFEKLSVYPSYLEEEGECFHHDVLFFDSMEEEVRYVFNDICMKKENGVSLNDILLFRYGSEYDLILRKYAEDYGLPMELKSDYTLDKSPLFLSFVAGLNEGKTPEEAYEELEEHTQYDEFRALPKLVKIINESLSVKENTDFIPYLVKKAAGTKLKAPSYEEAVRLTDASYRGGKYVYLMGFSLGSYPGVKKDTDLFSDEEKKKCGRNTSLTENEIAKEELVDFLNHNEHLIITKKEKIGKEVYYDSLLIQELGMKKIKGTDDGIRYSLPLAEKEVSSYQDDYAMYGTDNAYREGVDPSSFGYHSFSHDFTPSPSFRNDGEMKMSYSSVNDYMSCPFQYFVKRVARVPFEDTFFTSLGNLFHHILQNTLESDFHMEDYRAEIEENFVTPKDRHYIEKLLPQVEMVIRKNKELQSVSLFNKATAEQELFYPLNKKTKITGFVDKFLVHEKEGGNEIAVVDYKTYNVTFQKNRVEYGLSLQLPTYGLLLKNQYKDARIVGLYIQKIAENKPEEEDAFLLNGITLRDEDVTHALDPTAVKKSTYIKGISYKKEGDLSSNKSLIEESELNALIEITKQKFLEAESAIREGKFDIRPYLINDKDSPCSKCPLGAICFHDPKDYRRIEIDKEQKEDMEKEEE